MNEPNNELENEQQKEKWYFKGYSLFGSFLLFGPFMLPLVWLHPKYSRAKKTVLTIVIGLISILLFEMLLWAGRNIYEYYKLLGNLLNGTY